MADTTDRSIVYRVRSSKSKDGMTNVPPTDQARSTLEMRALRATLAATRTRPIRVVAARE